MVKEFDKRRPRAGRRLEGAGLSVPWPRGAFYAFPDVSQGSDERGSARVLRRLAGDPDLAVGARIGLRRDDHVRLSYATSI